MVRNGNRDSGLKGWCTAWGVAGAATAAALMAGTAGAAETTATSREFSNDRDLLRERTVAERLADWRNGAVVYQVIVDRFAPPADREAKRPLYPEPKKLHSWEETPRRGHEIPERGLWSHELDFWGGDFGSLRTRLDYVAGLGVDVLYLNPIHRAYTNHKYDAQDYFDVSPEYGSRADVGRLASDLHGRGLKLMLDGVFNHMGRTAPAFLDAQTSPGSPWREWYVLGPEYRRGYRAWYNVGNLPELNLESPRVRARLWGDPDSVIQGYLRNEGIDGWRLDVAFDIGFRYLSELTAAAHRAKPGSLVIGEIWNYPEEWIPSVDGTMNMTLRQMILGLAQGKMNGARFGRMVETMVEDCGLEALLKCWVILDNHDTPRLRAQLPETWQQRLAQTLQFSLPGSPCLYYGAELGMEGADDPENRGPMRWDLVNEENDQYRFTRRLLAARRNSPALRAGEIRVLPTERLLAFQRTTDRAEDFRLVIANTEATTVTEWLLIRDSKLMSGTVLKDMLQDAGDGTGDPAVAESGRLVEFRALAGMVTVDMPPRSAVILHPVVEKGPEYTPYKRVR